MKTVQDSIHHEYKVAIQSIHKHWQRLLISARNLSQMAENSSKWKQLMARNKSWNNM